MTWSRRAKLTGCWCAKFLGPDILFRGRITLVLWDTRDRVVRMIDGDADWTRGGAEKDAVGNLIKERRLDEEIHKPLPAAPRQPGGDEGKGAR